MALYMNHFELFIFHTWKCINVGSENEELCRVPPLSLYRKPLKEDSSYLEDIHRLNNQYEQSLSSSYSASIILIFLSFMNGSHLRRETGALNYHADCLAH